MQSSDTPTEAPRRRAYDASRRRAAAEVRRARVVSVAADSFAENGWGGTTIAEVARLAEVSPELVAAAFGTKAALFVVAFRSRCFGEYADLQEAFAALRLDEEPDVEVRLDRFVAFACTVLPPMAPYVPILAAAMAQDAAVAEHLSLAASRQYATAEELAGLLARGPLGPDAVDEVYLVTRAEPFLALVCDRGWSLERYGAWLRRSLLAALSPS